MIAPASFWLICPKCGVKVEPGPRWYGCDACLDAAGYPHWLEVAYDLNAVDPGFLTQPGRVWEYAPLLPLRNPASVSTLGEGLTPLVSIAGLNRELGLPNLFLKFEYVNPTGSFKDRLHTVSMAVAREMGFTRAVLTTTGNSGVAGAAYAALNGISLYILADSGATAVHQRLMRLFGARVTIPGRAGPVMSVARTLTEVLVREHGFYPCTVLGTFAGPGNPYGVEGYKTIAFEVFGQLGFVPDRMCVPTSGGDSLYGPFKGFRELRRLGLTDRLPRMTACQPAGANFIVQALRENLGCLPMIEPNTFAISIGDPTGSQCILEAIQASNGDAWDAADDEIRDAMALLGRYGICVEGASAATIAALRRQTAADTINLEETIVAVLSGSGMTWPNQLDAASGAAHALMPDDLDSILRAMPA